MTSPRETAVVGPNAAIQLRAALLARADPDAMLAVFEAAGESRWAAAPPDRMIPESAAAALFEAVTAQFPPREAAAILAEAGRRTADYITRNRIPTPVRAVLRALPPVLAAPLLASAIRRASWTFAGSGACTTPPGAIEIAANPIATPGCPWHEAAFERLYTGLVSRAARVRHTACIRRGAPACRFEIELRG